MFWPQSLLILLLNGLRWDSCPTLMRVRWRWRRRLMPRTVRLPPGVGSRSATACPWRSRAAVGPRRREARPTCAGRSRGCGARERASAPRGRRSGRGASRRRRRSPLAAPVSVVREHTLTGARQRSPARRGCETSCGGPSAHAGRLPSSDFPLPVTAVATTARGGHAWLLRESKPYPPSRGRHVPSGRGSPPRPARTLPSGEDLLSLSPTGEEVSSQTVSFGDARALVPGGAR